MRQDFLVLKSERDGLNDELKQKGAIHDKNLGKSESKLADAEKKYQDLLTSRQEGEKNAREKGGKVRN